MLYELESCVGPTWRYVAPSHARADCIACQNSHLRKVCHHPCRADPARGAVDLYDSLRRQLPPLHRLSRDGRRSEAAALRRLYVHMRYQRRVNAAGAGGYRCCAPHTCIAAGCERDVHHHAGEHHNNTASGRGSNEIAQLEFSTVCIRTVTSTGPSSTSANMCALLEGSCRI